ncbi:MAG: hypothetical protein P8L75_04600 [Gammaproteobacteria bacterium]|nr:hypothetical protein [Gammaproteobacteria bacterium]
MNAHHPKIIALIHALEESEEPIKQSFKKIWPDVILNQYADFKLSKDRARGLDEAIIRERIINLGKPAIEDGADAILYTCSAFGGAINAAKEQFNLPVLRPNESAFNEAIMLGKTAHIFVTFAPSLELLVNEFKTMSKGSGLDVNGYLIKGALDDLKNHKVDAHNLKILEAVSNVDTNDTVILGQFSMARASDMIAQEFPNQNVINTPDSSVHNLKRILS